MVDVLGKLRRLRGVGTMQVRIHNSTFRSYHNLRINNFVKSSSLKSHNSNMSNLIDQKKTENDERQDVMSFMINPFSTVVKSPKLLDGKVSRSAGLKLRKTGEIICSTTGITTIIVVPGISNSICWKMDNVVSVPDVFPGHIGTTNDRVNIKMARLVGNALRLNLVNNAETDDGYWEAARLAADLTDFVIAPSGSGTQIQYNGDYAVDLANNATYMTGRNRDLHKYVFKLNSFTTEHPFTSIKSVVDLDQLVDQTWDIIIIKIHGRSVLNSPSVLMYDTVSNQETIYQENTSLARLMTTSIRDANFHTYLNYSKIELPAFQV